MLLPANTVSYHGDQGPLRTRFLVNGFELLRRQNWCVCENANAFRKPRPDMCQAPAQDGSHFHSHFCWRVLLGNAVLCSGAHNQRAAWDSNARASGYELKSESCSVPGPTHARAGRPSGRQVADSATVSDPCGLHGRGPCARLAASHHQRSVSPLRRPFRLPSPDVRPA